MNCNYSYLSDYATSGDDGYIVEPEEPQPPEIHKHEYKLYVQDNAEDMQLIVMRVCECGSVQTGYFKAMLTDEDGVGREKLVADGLLDYFELYGQITVTLMDETGAGLKTVVVTAQEKPVEPEIPVEPDEPEQPDQPVMSVEPEQPDEPDTDEPTTPVEPDTDLTEEEKGGNATAVVLFIVMLVLIGGGIAGYFIYKKFKNKKQN